MKPTLVFIPGNMCDHRLWSEVCVNHWQCEDMPLLLQDSIGAMAQSGLMKSVGPIIPVGFSLGGIVALEMARQAPERVKGLVLVDTNAGADLPKRAAIRPSQQARVLAGELATIIADELKPNYLAPQHRENGTLKDLLFDMAMGLGVDVFVAQSEALRTRADLGPVLDNFSGPVLLQCGVEDTLCPPQWHREMASRCRKATLHVVDGSGHMLPMEQPAAFSKNLQNWLNDNQGSFH